MLPCFARAKFYRGFHILLLSPAWPLLLYRLVADAHANSTVLVRATQTLTHSKTYLQAAVLQLLSSTAALYDAGCGLPVNQVPGDLRGKIPKSETPGSDIRNLPKRSEIAAI